METSIDGYVLYTFTSIAPASQSEVDYYKTSGTLLESGDYALEWPNDGTLILVKNESGTLTTKWSVDTDGHGVAVAFKDGKFYISNQSGYAIWKPVTGGSQLVLTPDGHLFVSNAKGIILWEAK